MSIAVVFIILGFLITDGVILIQFINRKKGLPLNNSMGVLSLILFIIGMGLMALGFMKL